MRRLIAAAAALIAALLLAASPAGASVQKLIIQDPGYWYYGNAIVALTIKCPAGENYTLAVTVKQGSENQGTAFQNGECSGSGQYTEVYVESTTGEFQLGQAKAKASASSTTGVSTTAGAFQVNVDKRITLIDACAGAGEVSVDC